MPDPIKHGSTAELEALVNDSAARLAEIQEELRRRRQAAEIDQLERHLEAARPKWSEIRAFLDTVVKELRGR